MGMGEEMGLRDGIHDIEGSMLRQYLRDLKDHDRGHSDHEGSDATGQDTYRASHPPSTCTLGQLYLDVFVDRSVPLTAIVSPVTYAVAGFDARKMITALRSSGSPQRPHGILFEIESNNVESSFVRTSTFIFVAM